MNFKIIVLSLSLMLVCAMASAQSGTPKVNIIGKWIMVKHTLPVDGKLVNKLNNDGRITYEFKNSGTYKLTAAFKYQGKWDTLQTVGKWKIAPDNKSIKLYDNRFLPPHDKDGISADHSLMIKKLTTNEFVTEEYWFSESPVGTSTYKKQ